jgi:hypothetical protein
MYLREYMVRCVYPTFLYRGRSSEHDREWLRRLDRHCGRYLAVAATVPMLAIVSVTSMPRGDIPGVMTQIRVSLRRQHRRLHRGVLRVPIAGGRSAVVAPRRLADYGGGARPGGCRGAAVTRHRRHGRRVRGAVTTPGWGMMVWEVAESFGSPMC